MSKTLEGKAALVTGSTQGLGAGIARRFAAEGARVVVTGRDRDRGAAVARDVQGVFLRADLADPAQAKRLAADALAALGGTLDVLVNSAALPERSTLETLTPEHFDRLFHVNLLAPLLLAQGCAKALAERSGCLINIGSVNAYMGDTSLLVYSATKGALMTATKNLSAALHRSRVRVHQLNIGWMDSEGERTIQASLGRPSGYLEEMARRSPTGRLLTPADIAEACVFLARDESAIFSGAVIDLAQAPVGVWGDRPKGRP